MSECGEYVAQESGLSKVDAEDLVQRMHEWARQRAESGKMPFSDAIRSVAGEMKAAEENMTAIRERNQLMSIKLKRDAHGFIGRFKTLGEGLLAFLEGTNKKIMGGRMSVDTLGKAVHGKFFEMLSDRLAKEDLLHDFKRGNLQHETWLEMGELKEGGKPGVSGSAKAMKMAKIFDDVTGEMVGRQNRAGAYINRLPGYILRQTHDTVRIRHAGGAGDTALTKSSSYQAWSAAIKPLLDSDKTYEGQDPEKFLRNVHEGLYTGVHGEISNEGQVMTMLPGGDIARKSSMRRVLHFKDAESAWQYNQQFGMKNLRDGILSDIHYRSRAIALMESLGPNPRATFDTLLRELSEAGRSMEDAAKQSDSLNNSLNAWKIRAAFNTVTGINDHPMSFSLSNKMSALRTIVSMAKMGAAAVTKSFADKAFLQSEMAFQGIHGLDTLGKQVSGMVPRTEPQKHQLRMMGVAVDGLIGNSLLRYTDHAQMSGWLNSAQRKFFDLNFLNYWTDVHKQSAAELMSAHLGEHAHLPFEQLPGELQNVLSLYELTGKRWDALRDTAKDFEGQKYVTAEHIPDIADDTIKSLVEEKGLTANKANILRERDRLDSQLRSYFADRVDYAVPTPGADTRKWMTMDTKSGTPLGEAVRLLMMFKSFPVAVMDKVLGRELYGRGSDSVKQWLLNDHKGKFHMIQLAAMLTASGYLANTIKDALKGKTPQRVYDQDGIHPDVLENAMMRGGALGMMGDVLFNEYDGGMKNILEQTAGPVLGQAVPAAEMFSKLKHGEVPTAQAGKLLLDNAPYLNLFYIRPALDYMFLWNLQEMMTPGTLSRMEHTVQTRGHQDFFLRPSDRVNHQQQ